MGRERWAQSSFIATFILAVLCTIPRTVLAQNDPPEKQSESVSSPAVYVYSYSGATEARSGVARVRHRIEEISSPRAVRREVYPILIVLSQDRGAGTQVSGVPTADSSETEWDARVVENDEPFITPEPTVEQVERVLLEAGLFATTDVLFEFDKSRLLPSSERILNTLGEVLLRHVELRLEVAGHTDSIGDTAYNQSLSEQRAAAVRGYLLESIGIDIDRIVACGYGESSPVASNASVTGRALNRRVEFRVLDPENPDRGC